MRTIHLCAALTAMLAWSASALTIVTPDTPSPGETGAAAELSEHLARLTGNPVPVAGESAPGSDPQIIYVGNTRFAAANGIAGAGLAPEEWRLKAAGNTLIIGGGEPRGVMYGALEFLERQGIVWLGEEFTYFPPTRAVTWDDTLELGGKPAFRTRAVYAYFREPQAARRRFLARNRQNFFHDEPGAIADVARWGVAPTYGSPGSCHTYAAYTAGWGEQEAGCFALQPDGRRPRAVNGSGPGQVCFTNPRTRELFAARLKEFIAADRAAIGSGGAYPWLYDISANDNFDKCVCAGCLAAAQNYGAYSGVVVEFTNAIADAIAAQYPDVTVQMFGYMFAQEPPRSGITARPNVLIRLAQLGAEFKGGKRDTLRPLTHPNNKSALDDLAAWSRVGKLSIWDYGILYTPERMVTSNLRAIGENGRIYAGHGVDGVFLEMEQPEKNAFYSLRLWLALRLMNHPELDAAAEINRFLELYYGAAAPAMGAYLTYLGERNDEITGLLNTTTLRRRTDLDAAFFDHVNALLDDAERAAASDPRHLKHVLVERALVDRVRLDRRAELPPLDEVGREALLERLTRNYQAVIDLFFAPGGTAAQQAAIALYCAGIRANIPPVAELAGRDVAFDLPWPKLTAGNGAKLVADPDAAGGQAIRISTPGEFHYGFYDAVSKRMIENKLKKSDIPKDEKFHLYCVGKITLSTRCYAWAHSSWAIQRALEEFYENIGTSNEYWLYLSLKAQGPAYVEGSTTENAVLLDRVLLVK